MIFDVKNYGAKGDGCTFDTKAIQETIDTCSASGGGQVLLSGGTFLIGTIILKTGVDLHLTQDAVLLGSPNCEDYPENNFTQIDSKMLPRERGACLIFAQEAENIGISGKGIIDCNGHHFIKKADDYWMPYERIDAPTPPRVVFFAHCKNVFIEDMTMTNQPAGWSFWIHDCDYVHFDKVKVIANVDYPNNDGIHINSSRNVTISNCCVTCGDDALIVRANNVSLKENKVCEKVTVTNCNLTSHSAGIRIGWINDGVIRNCTFSNIVMTDCTAGISVSLPGRGEERLADEGREDTLVENLSFNNIIMDRQYSCPIFIRIADNKATRCESVKNIYFNNIHSKGHQMPCIEGRKDTFVENIYFSNCSFESVPVAQGDTVLKHGACIYRDGNQYFMQMKYTKNISFNNTTFSCGQ